MPVKILYISNYGNIVGGGEISLVMLLENLDRGKYEPILLLPSDGDMRAKAEELRVPCLILKMPGLKNPVSAAKLPGTILKLRDIIHKNNVELIHSNTSGRLALYAGLSARSAVKPCVWHVRVMDSEPVTDRFLFSIFNRIIVNSAATGGRFAGFNGADAKVSVIYNAVDTGTFKPRPRDEKLRLSFGAAPEQLLIGIVGRIESYKGHAYFINAAEQLVNSGRADMRFVVVGDGSLLDKCKRLAAGTPAAARIAFAGKLDDVARVMNAIDILVLASDAEHFGRVVIEAMACGKPVVATDAGGVPEIIDNGIDGILVPPKNAAAIANALARLADSPADRDAISKRAIMKVESKFSIPSQIDQIQKVYRELLTKS